jgi:hypothetical protein
VNRLIIIEIKKPIAPRIKIPIAEIFAVSWYSFLEGFFRACHTLLHLRVNDFMFENIFAIKK